MLVLEQNGPRLFTVFPLACVCTYLNYDDAVALAVDERKVIRTGSFAILQINLLRQVFFHMNDFNGIKNNKYLVLILLSGSYSIFDNFILLIPNQLPTAFKTA